MISISLLNVKDNLERIKDIDNLHPDFLHIDVMDGLFVSNETDFSKLPFMDSKTDIHLMVYSVKEYIDVYKKYHPEYITFHIEAISNIEEIIDYLKSLSIKVGISIKPNTPVEDLIPYLDKIDLVLVMSVEPGAGGQKFIESSIEKIHTLVEFREQHQYHYLIEVDGGIDYAHKEALKEADILVVGSYITMSENYEERFRQMQK